MSSFFFFQAEDGIRDRSPSRGLGDVYKRQPLDPAIFAGGGVGVSGKRSGHCSGGRCSNCENLAVKDLFTLAGLEAGMVGLVGEACAVPKDSTLSPNFKVLARRR